MEKKKYVVLCRDFTKLYFIPFVKMYVEVAKQHLVFWILSVEITQTPFVLVLFCLTASKTNY